jgi:hypothetical protein
MYLPTTNNLYDEKIYKGETVLLPFYIFFIFHSFVSFSFFFPSITHCRHELLAKEWGIVYRRRYNIILIIILVCRFTQKIPIGRVLSSQRVLISDLSLDLRIPWKS